MRVRLLGWLSLAVFCAISGCASSRAGSAPGSDGASAAGAQAGDRSGEGRIPSTRQPTLDELDRAFDPEADAQRSAQVATASSTTRVPPLVVNEDPAAEDMRAFEVQAQNVETLIGRSDAGAQDAARALRNSAKRLGPAQVRRAIQLQMGAAKASGDGAVAHALAWELLLSCGPEDVDRCRRDSLNEAAKSAREAKDPKRAHARVADARTHDACVKKVESAARRKGADLPDCAPKAQAFYRAQKDRLMAARLQLARALSKVKADAPGASRELQRAEQGCTEARCLQLRRTALSALVDVYLADGDAQRAMTAALADLKLHAQTLDARAQPWGWTEAADRACQALDAAKGAGACRALERRQLGRHAYFDFSRAQAQTVGLSAEQVRKVNAHYGVSLETCLTEEAARLLPPAEARYTVRWVVENDGRVTQMKMDRHDLQDGPLAQCLRKQLAVWRYPKFQGEFQHVEQTFGVRAAVRRVAELGFVDARGCRFHPAVRRR